MSERLHEFYASLDTHALANEALAWGVRLLVAGLIPRVDWLVRGGVHRRGLRLRTARVAGDVIGSVNAGGTRRIDLVIGIAADADIGKAIGAVRELLAADASVLKEPALEVAVSQLADSRINLAVQPWVKS